MSGSNNSAPSEATTAGAEVGEVVEREVPPPDHAYVTLAEALSWIAFRKSVGCDALSVRLGLDVSAATLAHRQLRSALDDVLNHGRSGHIPFVGKYIATANTIISTVPTTPIEPTRLIDFARFNILRDGLEWGTGLTWHHYDGKMMLARVQQSRRDYYHSVQVALAELMTSFPPRAAGKAASGGIEVISTGPAEAQCRDWLIQEFDADPDKRRSKKSFRDAAIARYPGRLTERGFNLRVWPSVAQQYGRDQVGAKKKS